MICRGDNEQLLHQEYTKKEPSTLPPMTLKDLKKFTRHLLKPVQFLIVLQLIAQTTAVQASVLNSSRGVLVSGKQDNASVQDQHIVVDTNFRISNGKLEDAMNEHVVLSTHTTEKSIYRKVRASKSSPSDACSLTEEELNEVSDEPQDKEAKTNGTTSKSRCKQVESRVRLCIEEMKKKKYDSAAKTFSTLQSIKLLERIVKSVYADNVDHLITIREFLKVLPTDIDHNVTACTSLYELMRINNHFTNPKVLMLYNLISETMDMPQFKDAADGNLRDTLPDLKRELESHVRHILAAWSVKIGKGSYHDTLRLVELPFMTLGVEYLKLLTQLSYNDDSRNTDNVWEFVKSFKSRSENGIAYEALLNALLANDELYGDTLLKLAYKVKEFMDSADFRLASFEDRNRFKSIKNHLPDTVRFLFWNRVCIKNAHYKEYLVDSSADFIHLLKEKGRSLVDASGTWLFKPSWDGTSFHIVNSVTEECMTVSSSKEDSMYHIEAVKKCMQGQDWLWKIILSHNAKQIYIRNIQSSNAVYVGDADRYGNRYPFSNKAVTRTYKEFELESC